MNQLSYLFLKQKLEKGENEPIRGARGGRDGLQSKPQTDKTLQRDILHYRFRLKHATNSAVNFSRVVKNGLYYKINTGRAVSQLNAIVITRFNLA